MICTTTRTLGRIMPLWPEETMPPPCGVHRPEHKVMNACSSFRSVLKWILGQPAFGAKVLQPACNMRDKEIEAL
jgi:hypothetical protein